MLALRIDYVTGRSVATSYVERQAAEWPPHPARVYSALVATWADADTPCPCERAALTWLETLPAPSLTASDAARREVVKHYVPDNAVTTLGGLYDQLQAIETAEREVASRREAGEARVRKQLARAEKNLRAAGEALASLLGPVAGPTAADLERAMAVLPGSRSRQERYFPSVCPDDPVVYVVWQTDAPEEHRQALCALASRVIRIGHSSSLVRLTVGRQAPAANWHPDDEGADVLRIPAQGQLARLEAEWKRHREVEPRVMPCRYQSYRRGDSVAVHAMPCSVFDDRWIVFRRVGGPRLPSTRAVDVASAVRGALLRHAEDPPPEALSGHRPDGEPAEQPHLAILALPFVGHRQADGSILGVALVQPRASLEVDRRAILRAIGRWEEASRREDEDVPTVLVHLGKAGVLELARIAWGQPPSFNLTPDAWCAPATDWLSVMPVALDRNPGDLDSDDPARAERAFAEAARIIANACVNVGLPEPESVVVLPSATLPGTLKARHFPPFPADRSRTRRVKVQARIRFAEPVRGPILLGAGRYFGLGLFRPMTVGG